MQLFETGNIEKSEKSKLKAADEKQCFKCSKYSDNTVRYTKDTVICIDCYLKLIAKRKESE